MTHLIGFFRFSFRQVFVQRYQYAVSENLISPRHLFDCKLSFFQKARSKVWIIQKDVTCIIKNIRILNRLCFAADAAKSFALILFSQRPVHSRIVFFDKHIRELNYKKKRSMRSVRSHY
jgi:hypothetical protein